MLQEWRTFLKGGDKKKKKKLSQTTPAKQMLGQQLLSLLRTKETQKIWIAAHELPQLLAQTRNLTADRGFPFAEFGILTTPLLPDYTQI